MRTIRRNKRRWVAVGLVLGRHRRRWININLPLTFSARTGYIRQILTSKVDRRTEIVRYL